MKSYILITSLIACSLLASGESPKDAKGKTAPATGITSDQASAILAELQQIRALLEKQQKPAAAAPAPTPTPTHAAIKLDDSFATLGRSDAPITVVEFTDYECPYCRQFHLTTFHDLRKNYIDTGKIRFITVDLPLVMHSNSHRAAIAARCAGEQNQFWAMREALISNGTRLAGDTIPEIARSLYMDVAAFQTCLDSGKYEEGIKKTVELSNSLGIEGTPTFLIGPTTGSFIDGDVVIGALPYAEFETKLKNVEVK